MTKQQNKCQKTKTSNELFIVKTSLMFYSYRITITKMFSECYLAKNLPLSK